MHSSDVIAIGGGLVGTAVAYGLGRLGKKVTVLDEGRAANGLPPFAMKQAATTRTRSWTARPCCSDCPTSDRR